MHGLGDARQVRGWARLIGQRIGLGDSAQTLLNTVGANIVSLILAGDCGRGRTKLGGTGFPPTSRETRSTTSCRRRRSTLRRQESCWTVLEAVARFAQ
jgi:hypothetical protein